jgi:hypothetical protein
MGRQGKRYVLANYQWDNIVARYRRVLEEVASGVAAVNVRAAER